MDYVCLSPHTLQQMPSHPCRVQFTHCWGPCSRATGLEAIIYHYWGAGISLSIITHSLTFNHGVKYEAAGFFSFNIADYFYRLLCRFVDYCV